MSNNNSTSTGTSHSNSNLISPIALSTSITPAAGSPTSGSPWSTLHSTVSGDPIFLQTKLAQGIAGAFVWVALFLTCQQVRKSICNNLVLVLEAI